VGVGVGVGIGVIVRVGVNGGVDVGVDVGVGVVVAFISKFAPHPTKPAKNDNESNKIPALKKTFFLFILVSFYGLLCRPTRGQAAILFLLGFILAATSPKLLQVIRLLKLINDAKSTYLR
jgi:hypothetical protein